MFQFKKLAIAGAITASIMGATAAEAHVSYHMSSTFGQAPNTNGTALSDVWSDGAPAVATGATAATRFNLPATWSAELHSYNTVYDVSAADAIANHGAAAGFRLESTGNRWKPTGSWGNALDYGLIDLDVAGNLKITIGADSTYSSTFAPGFTLWSGWGLGGNKHQAWNVNPNAPTPLGMTGITYVGHATNTTDGGSATKTFDNLAAGKYLLFIGGNGSDNSNEFYKASLSVAPVPVPGAVWLFGTAMAGMVGIGRRKAAISA
jgi:hypothetical protein